MYFINFRQICLLIKEHKNHAFVKITIHESKYLVNLTKYFFSKSKFLVLPYCGTVWFAVLKTYTRTRILMFEITFTKKML